MSKEGRLLCEMEGTQARADQVIKARRSSERNIPKDDATVSRSRKLFKVRNRSEEWPRSRIR
jgi:hypothetical protein